MFSKVNLNSEYQDYIEEGISCNRLYCYSRLSESQMDEIRSEIFYLQFQKRKFEVLEKIKQLDESTRHKFDNITPNRDNIVNLEKQLDDILLSRGI